MSQLGPLPPEVLEELISGAVRMRFPAGSVTHREGEDARHLELVISGVVRAYVTAPDGRTMTIRYCRSGALLGAASLFATEFTMPGATQALTDTDLLRLSPTVASLMAERDVRVARAFLKELSDRVLSFVYEIPGSAFASVRQRVARHLLDLASEAESDARSGGELMVRVSQQELAAAAGTVREVVVRVLRELRREGVVRTGRDGIIIIDPKLLTRSLGWNPGS
jgi:CRP/FNR family cyclic AMP-dependent transcriptional regulator